MHAIYSWRGWLSVPIIVAALVVLAGLGLGQEPLAAARTSVSVTPLIIAGFVATPVWRLLWLLPFVQERFPLPDGVWMGTQTSNWPIIKALKDAAKGDGERLNVDDVTSPLPALLDTPVRVEVASSFFGVYVALTSLSGYQSSRTIASVLTPAQPGTPAKLTYVFRADVPVPEGTDERHFSGAAELELSAAEDGLILQGCTWTNRQWSKGLNTAGRIRFRRTENWSWKPFKKIRFGKKGPSSSTPRPAGD